MNRNNQRNEIQEIMMRRRQRFDDMTRRRLGVSDMRNDNDDDLTDRNRVIGNNFMEGIDANYYLNDEIISPATSDENINIMNANGNVNELHDDNEDTNKKNLKEKALELETFIVERLARDKLDDAKKLFTILERMYRKFKDDNVKDVYFRVLQSLPKNMDINPEIYSYRRDKNNFKDVLKKMKIEKRVKAMNEENPCINSMGDMWDECDLNICSDKCRENILKASRQSQKKECSTLYTGFDTSKDKPVKMQEDIKKLVLDRLSFCKRVSDYKRKNPDSITFTDNIDLKNNMIKDIKNFSNLINLHYIDCYTLASEFVNTDEKTKQIIKLLKEIDYDSLSLERLTDLRNSLSLMPSCDKLRYDEQQDKRDKNIKEGQKIGKYIIPKNTDFYDQINGKEKAHIYKDIASEKNYLYDPYSKTITGIQHPMTSETILNKNLEDDSFVIPALSDDIMAKSYNEELKLAPAIPFELKNNNNIEENKMMAPEISEAPIVTQIVNNNSNIDSNSNINSNNGNELVPTITEPEIIDNENNIIEEEKIIFNLTMKDILEYMFLILVILVILFVFGILL